MLTKTRNISWELAENSLGGILVALWWLYLNISSIEWLFASLRDGSIFNALLLSLVIGSLGILGFWHRHRVSFSAIPQWDTLPAGLTIATGVGAIALRWFLDIPQLSAILFLIGSYALTGLFINRQIWRSGLTVAILFACVFPFSLQISVGAGFPLRVMTAYVVEHLLNSWGLPAISSHDIIVLEGRIAYVDLPCSGIKSLWTGTIFLLAATWLENRVINWRWLGVFVAHICLLIGANIERVAALVLINNEWQAPELAKIVHFPLGILGFSTACFISWLLLRLVSKNSDTITSFKWKQVFSRDRVALSQSRQSPKQLSKLPKTAIALLLTGLILIPQPPPVRSQIPNIQGLNLPGIVTTELPLSQFESTFFGSYPDTQAVKKRFKLGNISGSFILVSTTSFEAHHAPEICLTGNGLQVDNLTKKQLSKDIKGRWISLHQNRGNAAYWFQSPTRTTDEFLDRFWSDVSRQEKSWTLVSILFDRPTASDAPEVKTLVNELHRELIALQ